MREHAKPIMFRFTSFVVASVLLGLAYFFLKNSVDLRKLVPDDHTRIAVYYIASTIVPFAGFLLLAGLWGLWNGTSLLVRGVVFATCAAMPFVTGYVFFYVSLLSCALIIPGCQIP